MIPFIFSGFNACVSSLIVLSVYLDVLSLASVWGELCKSCFEKRLVYKVYLLPNTLFAGCERSTLQVSPHTAAAKPVIV